MSFISEEIFLGIMSGTSCDGLDLALVSFQEKSGRMHYRFLRERMIAYNAVMQKRLLACAKLSALELVLLERDWTMFVADSVQAFLSDSEIKPICLGFHGHTVFHRPDLGYTIQMGNGAMLSSRCGIDVVCDFRQQDVALNGQGAPLVPLGERDLFPEYEAFLNLGGFANATLRNRDDSTDAIRAFDVCAANIVLNRYAKLLEKEYDENGAEARKGQVNAELLDSLNAVTDSIEKSRNSLGVEWLDEYVIPCIERFRTKWNTEHVPQNDYTRTILATFTEHIAVQCGKKFNTGNVLVSGGGAYNVYLFERMQLNCKASLKKADNTLIDFKEALIFAYLAYCRVHLKENTLVEVTGASKPMVSGAFYKA